MNITTGGKHNTKAYDTCVYVANVFSLMTEVPTNVLMFPKLPFFQAYVSCLINVKPNFYKINMNAFDSHCGRVTKEKIKETF